MRTRWLLVLVVALLPLACAGCVQLPHSGPVVNGSSQGAADSRLPSDIDPEPPQQGQSRLAVVNGFVEAMTAWPITTTVAKEYLTADAAREWNPQAGTIVYSNFAPPTDDTGGVTVRLSGASRLDSSGAWRGEVPAQDQTLRFHVVLDHGEYRIVNPPNAMVVPTTWFQQRFGQVALYYFDAQARFLVPEPVFVPLGDQLPTALVSALLAGPPRGLTGVVRTFLPAGLSIGLSVPVSPSGVADIGLVGEQTQVSAQEADLLLAQLAATLRQDAAITGFRVTVNDQPLRPGSAGRTYPVDFGVQYAATATTDVALYGIKDHRLVGGDANRMLPVPGPFGSGDYGLDSVAVAPDGRRAVAVTDGGTTALEAPMSAAPNGSVHGILGGAVSLARPTIDMGGRIWLLDRRAHGAIVYCSDHGRLRAVTMAGVTGKDATRLLVSRDGSRLLAVVHRASGDQVVGERVATAPDGRVERLVHPFRVPSGATGHQVLDIAWAAPTRLAILEPTRPKSLYQVDIVPVDGSTVGADTLSTVIGGHVRGLAGSPDADLATYAVLDDSLVDVRTRLSTPLAGRPDEVAYPG